MSKLRRALTGALTAALLLTVLVIPVSAHGGGHHGGRRAAAQSATVYCTYCQENHVRGVHCADTAHDHGQSCHWESHHS